MACPFITTDATARSMRLAASAAAADVKVCLTEESGHRQFQALPNLDFVLYGLRIFERYPERRLTLFFETTT
jgi:hypothetical protein